MIVNTNSDIQSVPKKTYDDLVRLKNEYGLLKKNIDEEKEVLRMERNTNSQLFKMYFPNDNKSENSIDNNLMAFKKSYFPNDSVDNNTNEICRDSKNDSIEFINCLLKEEILSTGNINNNEHISMNRNLYEIINKNNQQNYNQSHNRNQNQNQNQNQNNSESEHKEKETETEKEKENIHKKRENVDNALILNENISFMNYTEKGTEDQKMKRKIKKLLKLIEILKRQLHQKDEEIYKMEVGLHLNSFRDNRRTIGSDEPVDESKYNRDINDDDMLLERMKNMLISQNNDITILKEELEKNRKELCLLKDENDLKNEKLLEAKKSLEKNYLLLTQYKSMAKEYEKGLSAKLCKVENCLNSEGGKLEKQNLRLNEKNLNIEMQKKIITTMNEEIKKKNQTIEKLRNIIEKFGVNSNKDIIKFKQCNIDLLNKLSLNNSLLNNQKIEIENLHLNFKELEEDLKKKDSEIKTLHETILDKEEENNRLKADLNRYKFDLEIKNVNLVNMKKKMKNIQKENTLNLKRQKDLFMNTLNEECSERDIIITNKTNEIEKLISDNSKLLSFNADMEKQMTELKKQLLKKDQVIADVQDELLGYQAKLMVYENNNEIDTLKKSEKYLRKKLTEQVYKNEQLVNNSFLLQKSAVENYTLEKQILELKGAIFAKDEEIKKLKKKKENHDLSSNENYNTNPMLYNNGMPVHSLINAPNTNSSIFSDSSVKNSHPINLKKEQFIPNKDDPIDLALYDYLKCFTKNNHNVLNVQKIDTHIYSLNDKKVIIRFLNGELFVEDNSYPVKLQNYLLQMIASSK